MKSKDLIFSMDLKGEKMGISKEQEEKAKKKFEEDTKNVDKDDVDYAAKKKVNQKMIKDTNLIYIIK